jgi:hypothetical protein
MLFSLNIAHVIVYIVMRATAAVKEGFYGKKTGNADKKDIIGNIRDENAQNRAKFRLPCWARLEKGH